MADFAWLTARPIAHRGLHDGNKLIWENTLSAYSRAIDGNFSIECDVHLTKDGGVVVFHDGDLRRLVGREGNVHDYTLAQMTAMAIGDTKDQAPSLDQLLAHVDGKVPLVIELKGDEGFDEGLVGAVAEQLNAYHGRVAVMSFDHHIIRQFKKHMPDIPCGLTAEGMRDQDIEGHFAMLAHGIDFVSYNVYHLPNRFITFVREKLAMPVITWTITSAEGIALTRQYADQVTFELIDPRHQA